MISPGTLLESKTWVLPGVAAMADSCGFQVTTACTLGAAKAPTMSASEVLTTLMSRSRRPAAPAREQIVGHGELHEMHALALQVLERLAGPFRTMPSLPLE